MTNIGISDPMLNHNCAYLKNAVFVGDVSILKSSKSVPNEYMAFIAVYIIKVATRYPIKGANRRL